MSPFLRQQLDRQRLRLDEIDAALADPAIGQQIATLRSLNREHARVAALVERWDAYQAHERTLVEARAMLDDPEMAELARAEIEAAEAGLATLGQSLQAALLPRAEDDENESPDAPRVRA